MKETNRKERKHSLVLIAIIIIGLLAGLFLVQQRHAVEQAQNQIENIVDYDAVLRASSFEKRSTEDALKALKEAGVTGMAIYDRTLAKARDAGEVLVYPGEEAFILQFYGPQPQPGYTYIVADPGKEGYFKEIHEDLVQRLGKDKVGVMYSNRGPVLALAQPYEALMDMNLSISRLQAEEVSRQGFDVIVRPTNFKQVTKENVDLVFSRLDGIPNITGMVFVGKEALGYPNYIGLTNEYLHNLRIPKIRSGLIMTWL